MLTAFVGAGGKTTAIYHCAGMLREHGRRSIITTTTHMQYPVPPYDPLCLSAAAAEQLLGTRQIAVCGTDAGKRSGIHKITALPENDFERCRSLCDYMLVEADGARRKPLKAPGLKEPVIPRGTDTIVVCAGLDAVGGTIDEVCFRTELVESILAGRSPVRIDGGHVITGADVARILWRGYLLPYMEDKTFAGCRLYVLLNKADLPSAAGNARRIVSQLRTSAAPCCSLQGACLRGYYTAALREGELSYEDA